MINLRLITDDSEYAKTDYASVWYNKANGKLFYCPENEGGSDDSQIPPSNQIWYTTTDGQIFNLLDVSILGKNYSINLISNTYENGKGVMVFDSPVTELGLKYDDNQENIEEIFPLFVLMDENENALENTLLSVILPNCVTNIGIYSFTTCTSLTSITIPDGVINIGDIAFAECTSLSSVTIPNSVTSIGQSAFQRSSLTEITIPGSVISIGDSGFTSCSNLKEVTIQSGVTSIPNGTFAYCEKLSKISIPDSVTSIGDSAFVECTSLTSITIPDSVINIGDVAFKSCSNLTTIHYSGTATGAPWGAPNATVVP